MRGICVISYLVGATRTPFATSPTGAPHGPLGLVVAVERRDPIPGCRAFFLLAGGESADHVHRPDRAAEARGLRGRRDMQGLPRGVVRAVFPHQDGASLPQAPAQRERAERV